MLNDTIREVPVAGRWEACGAFAAGPDGTPVCAECGWLDREHRADATVHELPRRLAS